MKNIVGFLVLCLMVVCFGNWLYSERTYRYRITVPDGRYPIKYYTNAYTQRGSCIVFRQAGRSDSSQVCGMYSITRLR